MSICPQCIGFQPLRQGQWCRECKAAWMRTHRRAYAALTPEERRRSNARAKANVYQRRGKLMPQGCRLCGAGRAQKHHPDYERPLDVVWLCAPCHRRLHARQRTDEKIAVLKRAIVVARR